MSTSSDSFKRSAAVRALDFVCDGMVVGLGSGSTSEIFVTELSQRVRQGLRIIGIPTSLKTERLAQRLGVPLADLNDHVRLDLAVDGADEIHLQSFNLIKGGGGSLLREKLVAVSASDQIVIADEGKMVERLGERRPLPVEVVRFGWRRTAEALESLGGRPSLRSSGGGEPFLTDEGHYILDCKFTSITEPDQLAAEIKAITGVVEHGLFIRLAARVILGGADGARVCERGD